MKIPLLLVAVSFTPWLAASSPAQAPSSAKEKLSYAMGMQIGSSIKREGIDVDGAFLSAAVRDAVAGGKTQMTNEEMISTLTAFSKEMQAKQQVKQQALMAKQQESAGPNKAEGEKFLAANKTKPDVKTTATGLQYKVLKEGTGPVPKATDTVTVNYRGTLINGTEFDSSYKRNEPATFPVNGVIPGWTEALQLMKVGAKYQLFIPSALAYAERGTPDGSIAPNSTLIFEVELLGVK